MNDNEQLIALLKAMVNDPKVTAQSGWQKIIMVGKAEGSTSMAGYSFDAVGAHKPVAPSVDTLMLLRQLHKSMKATNATGRGWKACLLRIARNGEVGADFEYEDGNRWAVTPGNLESRIKEFAVMPV